MPTEVYAVVASAARYWFLFLGVLIVWRSYSWLRKDGRAQKKRVKRLPDAGYVGEMVVLAGSAALPVGTVLPLPREGTIGCLRGCDVVVPVDGVLDKHAAFAFRNGKGLLIEPYFHGEITVDSLQMDKRGKPLVMYHGSRLIIGEAVLRMRLFVGVDAPRPAAAQSYRQDEPEDAGVYHQRAQLWQTDRFQPVSGDYEDAYEDVYEDEDAYEDAYDDPPQTDDWDDEGGRG